MNPLQVTTEVAQALGEGDEATGKMLGNLFSVLCAATPADWDAVDYVVSTQSIVQDRHKDPLLDALKALVTQDAVVGVPGEVFDDFELRGHFLALAQGPDTGRGHGVPVADGSLIQRVGQEFYLGESYQVWQAGSGDAVYYHDGSSSYDVLGRPLEQFEAGGAAPAPGQSQPEDPAAWNTFLDEHGAHWDGTEDSWQRFRDWFLYHAQQNQVGQSAHGFITLAENSSDKRAVFAEYGIELPSLSPTRPDINGQDPLRRLHHEVMEPALAAVLADPRFAELGEVRLRELLADVTAGHLVRLSA